MGGRSDFPRRREQGAPRKRRGGRAGTPRPRRRRKRAALAQLRRGRPALGARAGAGAPRFGRKGRGGGAGRGAPVWAEGRGPAADSRGGVSPGSAPAARPLQGTVRDRDARRGDPQPGPAGLSPPKALDSQPRPTGSPIGAARPPGRFLGVADDPSLMKRATLGSRESRPSSHDRFGSEELGFASPNPPAAYCAPPPLPPLAVIDPRAPRDSQSPPFFIGGLYLILFAQLSWRRVNKGVESGEKAFPRWKQ